MDFLTSSLEKLIYVCPITAVTFREKLKFKVESLLCMHRKHVTHCTRSADLKKLFYVSIYCIGPGVGHSNGSNC